MLKFQQDLLRNDSSGAIPLIVPIIVGFSFGPEVLGGLLAGVTVSGVLMGIFKQCR